MNLRGAGAIWALPAVPVAYAAHYLGGLPATIACALGAFAVALLSRQGRRDGFSRFGGQLLALTALSGGLWFAGVPAHVFPWPGWVGGLVVCQGLTILIGRRYGPVWRDVLAGASAVIIVLVAAGASHGWFA